jgi:ferredoxin
MVERKIAGLTVLIDRDSCIGTGACVAIAPEHLELDSQMIVAFKEEPGETTREAILEACQVCPVEALKVRDESGAQIVG